MNAGNAHRLWQAAGSEWMEESETGSATGPETPTPPSNPSDRTAQACDTAWSMYAEAVANASGEAVFPYGERGD
jgi:hypothetical protein